MRALELVHLGDPLEVARVDDGDRAEDDALEVPGEHAQQREERVPPEAAVAADEEDRDRLLAVDAPGPRSASRFATLGFGGDLESRERVGQLDVEPADRGDDARVVALDRRSRALTRTPVTTSVSQPPSANFSSTVTTRIVRHSAEADEVDRQVPVPVRVLLPVLDPEARHAEVRQREREKHVDRVHDDELLDVAVRVEQRGDRRAAHEQDAVLHAEALGERREAVRQPRVDRHVRHDARPVDEARLRGDEEEARLGRERDVTNH